RCREVVRITPGAGSHRHSPAGTANGPTRILIVLAVLPKLPALSALSPLRHKRIPVSGPALRPERNGHRIVQAVIKRVDVARVQRGRVSDGDARIASVQQERLAGLALRHI